MGSVRRVPLGRRTTSSPTIIIATKPSEVVVTEGTPAWVPLAGTNLLYVKNTTANIFMDMQSQNDVPPLIVPPARSG